MDEQEYLEYCRQVFGLEFDEPEIDVMLEQLRDDDGEAMPGCYRARPLVAYEF